MAWTTPRTWVTNEIVTAAQLNSHLRDNTRFLKGLDGNITLEDRVIIDGDANFYAEIDGGSDALLSMDSTDTFKYDRGANFFQFNIAGAEEAQINANGLKLASGNYIDYNGTYYAVVTDEGTQKLHKWGYQGVSWTGGADLETNIATGLTTVEAFTFMAMANGIMSRMRIDRDAGMAGGTVRVVSQNASTESGTIHWMATGV
jgi:hypothetical protein